MIVTRKALIVVAAFVLMALGLPWGGNVPAAFAQTISVTAADPPTGEQGTLNLNVIIKGKGFKNGAKAKFFKTGTTDPAGVNVKSTQYVSSTQLIALVDIADAATLALFDIEVRNADGRTGKGTELFAVTAKSISVCSLPDPEPSPSGYISDPPGLAGYLDSTFGSGAGRVVGPRHLRVGYGGGRAIAIDGAGRILAVGLSHNDCVSGAPFEWGIARYASDGSLDSSFGVGGIVTVGFAGTPGAKAVAVQPDGKIVVVGAANPSRSSSALPVVVRFNGNGSLDGSFGTGGVAWVSPGGKSPNGSFNSVALQSGGKIVAVGAARASGLVSRLNTNGTLDTGFNGSGSYITPTPPCCSTLVDFNAVATQWVQGQERIVVAGAARDSLNHRIGAVWRFESGGALDPSFGTAGVVTTAFHEIEDGRFFEEMFKDVVVDSFGRIVAAGYAGMSTPPDTTSESWLALARYDNGGVLDASFGVGGRVVAWSGQDTGYGYAVAIQSSGRIVVAGRSHNNDGTGDLAGLWWFTDSGLLDLGFGSGGWVAESTAVGWTGMALQVDGKIVCGGIAYVSDPGLHNPTVSFAVLGRYWQ